MNETNYNNYDLDVIICSVYDAKLLQSNSQCESRLTMTHQHNCSPHNISIPLSELNLPILFVVFSIITIDYLIVKIC